MYKRQLDGFDKVRICTGYRLRGKILDYFPAHAADQAEVEPIYEEMDLSLIHI